MKKHVIYDWEDGSHICFTPSVPGIISQFVLRDAKLARLRLYWNPQARVLSTTPDSAIRMLPPKLHDSDVRKIRGFILGAGFPHPKGPSLISVDPDDEDTKIYYPKWIEENRWNQRYEEAEQRVILGRPPGIGDWPTPATDFLGCVENVVIFKDRFVSKTRGDLPFKIWWGHWKVSSEKGNDLVATIKEAVDIISERRLFLPESARGGWEKANVVRGEFVLPSQDEVEVFRILDQELPILLPSKSLEEWIASRGGQ